MEPFLQEMQKDEYAPIAIYGLGVNARRLMHSVLGERIQFVIAKDHIGEDFFGHTVQSIEDVLPHCKTIIIAATLQVTRIIYKRIVGIVPDDKYIFNMYGMRLNASHAYRQNSYWQQDYPKLLREIDTHQAISFDCFDTLFMRRTLLPQDIFAVVGTRVDAALGSHFAEWRIEAEQVAVERYCYPTLREIYMVMQEQYHLHENQICRLREQELAVEQMALCPRRTVLAALRYAINQGKKVFITTDTYFPAAYISSLLIDADVPDGYTVLASCTCRASKADGSLYELLREKASTSDILHIGDNRIVDGYEAEQHHIDTFPLLSAYDMLQASSCQFVCEHLHNVDERHVLGNILAEVLNDPFALAPTQGKLMFRDAKTMALMCQLPVVQGYLAFLLRIVRGRQGSKVLFISRDGYFLKQAYDQLRKQDPSLPESIYFYASREAMTKALCQDKRDIEVLLSDFPRMHGTTLKRVLRQRFHVEFPEFEEQITVDEAITQLGMPKIREVVFAHATEIFTQAAEARRGYQAYLASLSLPDQSGSDIFLVDLCTRGTVAYGLRRLLDRPVHLIALGGLFLPNAYLADARQYTLYFGTVTPFSSSYSLFPVLELLFASREGQAAGFNAEGKPVFSEGTAYRCDLLDEVQTTWLRALAAPWMHALAWWNMQISADFVENVLEIIRSEYSDVSDGVMKMFSFTDPLFKHGEMNVLTNTRA